MLGYDGMVASGGMVAPFVVPELEWDFRLPRVVSINTSGHKYGGTVAGCVPYSLIHIIGILMN